MDDNDIKRAANPSNPAKSLENSLYRVVLRCLEGLSADVLMLRMNGSKAEFDRFFAQPAGDGTQRQMRDFFEIVAEGVSAQAATRLIGSPANREAILTAFGREADHYDELAAKRPDPYKLNAKLAENARQRAAAWRQYTMQFSR